MADNDINDRPHLHARRYDEHIINYPSIIVDDPCPIHDCTGPNPVVVVALDEYRALLERARINHPANQCTCPASAYPHHLPACPKFSVISLEFGQAEFTIDDLWPDGDAPDPVTAEAVAELIHRCGGVSRIIRDWNIDLSIDIYVTTPNPNWHGDNVLIPPAPPRFISTRASAS